MLNGDRPRPDGRVWIIEPDSIFRSGLTTLLREHHYDVVAESDTLSQTGSAANVDVVMFDVNAVRLDEMLMRTADFYEQRVTAKVEGLSSLVEPVAIVLLGLVIALMLVALYLPIFNLGHAMRSGVLGPS